jgi:uncharacterized protein YraI
MSHHLAGMVIGSGRNRVTNRCKRGTCRIGDLAGCSLITAKARREMDMTAQPRRRARWLALVLTFACLVTLVGPAGLIPQPAAAATASTTSSLNLRASASLSAAVLLVIPSGATVETTGATANGFSEVVYQGTTGWAYSQYLSTGGGSTPGTVIGNAWVIDGSLNLRSGPGTSYGVLLVMPNQAQVGVTGSPQNGFTPVRYNGVDGWAYSTFLSSTAPGSNPAPSPGGQIIETRYATTSLNLRSGAGLGFAVLTVIPSGGQVGITGSQQNGFFPVRFNGTDGWASATYLSTSAPGSGETPPPSTPPPGNEIIDTRYTTAALNMRSGAGLGYSVLLVIPMGAEVGITGSSQNGFLPVRYNGTDGWASATYLSTSGPGSGETPPPASGPGNTIVENRYATAALNMRSGAGMSFSVVLVIPRGAEVGITGSQQNGFFPVRYNSTDGWASATYLTTTAPGNDPAPAPGPGTSDPIPGSGNSGGGSIVWPVTGGTWEITQGYNGSSHINTSSTYQYLYAIDIARQDRNTGGQSVYSPVSGTVAWTERASGGITINMGNGYAIALFHVTVDRSWTAGMRINQGDYIGYISHAGGEGFVQFPHLHMTVWATTDGGNWSRQSVPFSGGNSISGLSLADIGGRYQHTGTLFNP